MRSDGLQWALGCESPDEMKARIDKFTAIITDPAGWVGIEYRATSKVAEVNVCVAPEYCGSGAGKRLGLAGIKKSWDLGANKVSMIVLAGNPYYRDPARTLAHIGVSLEATLKQHYFFKGEVRDVHFFAKFKEAS